MSEILSRETIRLGLTATDKTDAITQCGSLLVAVGAVTQPYADAMFEREHQVPTYLGEGVAIPHGTNESREHIQRTCLGFLQFPGGVDWDGERVFVCIPIASRGEEHVEILGTLASAGALTGVVGVSATAGRYPTLNGQKPLVLGHRGAAEIGRAHV